MALNKILWAKTIQEALLPDNSFAVKSINDSSFVKQGTGKVVLPIAGALPNVVVNRSTFPAIVSERVDTFQEYNLDWHSTDPERIRGAEQFELSYDKRKSMVRNHIRAIDDSVYKSLLYRWVGDKSIESGNSPFPNANILLTSGADNGQGLRRAIREDFAKLKAKFTSSDVGVGNAYMLIPAAMEEDILNEPYFIDASKYGISTVKTGIIGSIFGINVMVRSATVKYDSTGALVGLNDVGATFDAIVAWDANSVSHAKGAIKIREDNESPIHYGNIFSSEGYIGGIRYRDSGVFVLRQTTV